MLIFNLINYDKYHMHTIQQLLKKHIFRLHRMHEMQTIVTDVCL